MQWPACRCAVSASDCSKHVGTKAGAGKTSSHQGLRYLIIGYWRLACLMHCSTCPRLQAIHPVPPLSDGLLNCTPIYVLTDLSVSYRPGPTSHATFEAQSTSCVADCWCLSELPPSQRVSPESLLKSAQLIAAVNVSRGQPVPPTRASRAPRKQIHSPSAQTRQ